MDYIVLPLKGAGDSTEFEQMTFSFYRPMLRQAGQDAKVVALCLLVGRQPAGLVLASLGTEETAEIQSVFVKPEYRRQGLATVLVREMENELGRRGVKEARATYSEALASADRVRDLLARRGWSSPIPRMMLVTLDCVSCAQVVSSMPWLHRKLTDDRCVIFPWSDLTAYERDHLCRHIDEGLFPRTLSPFQDEANIDLGFSVGVRYCGDIAGWLITHRVTPRLLRYTCLFVRPDLPVKGAGLCMLAEIIRRHRDAEGHNLRSQGTFGIFVGNPFADFVRRRLLPYLPNASVRQTLESYKCLVQ
jgi:GNAT superfamily N-acetyltransferase